MKVGRSGEKSLVRNDVPLNRRRFLGGAGVGAGGALGMALVGCGDDDSSPPAAASTSAGSGSPAASATGADAAATRPQEGSFLRFAATGNAFTTFDVQRSVIQGPYQWVYSYLLTLDDWDKGTVRGDIATGLPEQPDQLTFVFTLRPDVKWQARGLPNGRALTAEDVKWNMDRIVQQVDASGKRDTRYTMYAYAFQFVNRVEVTDPTHVKVTLKAPYAPWLSSMTHVNNVIVAKEVIEKLVDPNIGTTNPEACIGTGPYMLTEDDGQGNRTLVRNADYFGKKAGFDVQYVDRIVYNYVGADVNAWRAAFEQKQADSFGASSIPAATFDGIVSSLSGKATVAEVGDPNANLNALYSWQRGPYTDPQIRRAVWLAMDRAQMIKTMIGGLGRPSAMIPWTYGDWSLSQDELSKTPGFRQDKTQDLKDAKAMWDAGGGPALGELPFVYFGSYPGVEETFPAMMRQNLGANFKGIQIPVAQIMPHLMDVNFEVPMWSPLPGWTVPDPRSQLAALKGKDGLQNFGKYFNPKMEDLLSRAFAEFDTKKAQDIVKDAQRLIFEDSGAGHWYIANSVSRFLDWNYAKIRRAALTNNLMTRSWVDQKDATFAGRPGA